MGKIKVTVALFLSLLNGILSAQQQSDIKSLEQEKQDQEEEGGIYNFKPGQKLSPTQERLFNKRGYINFEKEGLDPKEYYKKYYEEFYQHLNNSAGKKIGNSASINTSCNPPWRNLGPFSVAFNSWPFSSPVADNAQGAINFVRFHPTNPNIIYVGTHGGGLWKSINNGISWIPLAQDLPVLSSSDLAFHPNTPDTLYFLTGDRTSHVQPFLPTLGLYKSVNGGLTWSTTGFNSSWLGYLSAYRILIHPNNPSVLLICSTLGIHRSTDGGVTWNLVNNFYINDIEFCQGNPSLVYAIGRNSYTSNTGVIVTSTNSGLTWNTVHTSTYTSLQDSKIEIAPSNTNIIYALQVADGFGQVIYKSSNAGSNWTLISTSSLNCWGNVLKIDPLDTNHIFTGGMLPSESTNGGLTFALPAWVAGVHADIRDLQFSPHNGLIYTTNDGGLLKINTNNSLTGLTSSMCNTECYNIYSARYNKNRIGIGTQDNATLIKFSNSTGWEIAGGGDDLDGIMNPMDTNFFLKTTYVEGANYSTSKWKSFYFVRNLLKAPNGNILYGNHDISPANSNLYYFAGDANVWKAVYTNANFSWTALSGSGYCDVVRVNQKDANVIYGWNGNSIRRSINAGASWTGIPLPAQVTGTNNIRSVVVHPDSINTIYISLGGLSNGNKIFKTTNGGSSWTNISYNLPNISNLCIDIYAPLNEVYVGTIWGIYRLTQGSATWDWLNNGLPVVTVTDMDFDLNAKKLRVCTYGRGVWETSLCDSANGIFYPDFAAEETSNNTCVKSYRLKSLVNTGVTAYQWTILPTSFQYINNTSANSQSPQVEFIQPGTYSIALTVTTSTGSYSLLIKNAIDIPNLGTSFYGLPYTENFENNDTCQVYPGLHCGIKDWENLSIDNGEWFLDQGPRWDCAPYGYGPLTDFNPGTAQGKYVNTHVFAIGDTLTAILRGPCISLASACNPWFKFAYIFNNISAGNTFGSVHVDLYDVSTGTLHSDIVSPKSSHTGTWVQDSLALTAFVGKNIKIHLRSITGTNACSHMSVDDIKIYEKNPNPTVSINANSSSVICTGKTATITPVFNGVSAYTLIPGGQTSLPFILSPTLSTNYTLTVKNAVGCTGQATTSITVKPSPTVSLNSGSICAGESFTLVPQGANVYTLSSFFYVVYPSVGTSTYSVKGSTGNGCLSNTAIANVTVQPLPQITISSDKIQNTICRGESIYLTASGASSYSWDTGAVNANLLVSPFTNTIFVVTAVDVNGCANTSSITVFVETCTGISENAAGKTEGFKVYPNPSEGTYTLETVKFVSITVYDVIGKLILDKKITSGKHIIDLTGYNRGKYLLKINDEGKEKTIVLIKN